MAGINSNLYPPIVDTYMPAFIYTEGCRVYFSISGYNSLAQMYRSGGNSGEADAVQVVVQSQKTNQSMLKESLYPSGIMLTYLQLDEERQGEDRYYIEIRPSDMEGGFNLNEYYKVQIRFTDAGASAPPTTTPGQVQQLDAWLSANLAFFSEWSTVVLIRGISLPMLELNDFSNDSDSVTFTSSNAMISGRVKFDDDDEETLKSYQIYIFDSSKRLLQKSGEIYTDPNLGPNQIRYFFDYEFETNVDYILGIQVTTKNLYSWPALKTFNFSIDEVVVSELNAQIAGILDDQGGRIGVHVWSNTAAFAILNLIVRRTSSKSNFRIWQDVYKTVAEADKELDFTWYDYTVESGVWYKYCVQKENSIGQRSAAVETSKPIMIVPQDIFLNAGGEQLKIRFDPQISSFSHTISESKQETIGSKYPFIRRNGSVNYRTFPLSGTITCFMDIRENLLNASKEDIYRNSKSYYDDYNQQHHITNFNDYVFERQFRKKVMDFLYKNNVKLFRSTTEGNILVKLMDISFTPNQTLGRMIYSFSCTAVEVDQYNIKNLIKYQILNLGSFYKREIQIGEQNSAETQTQINKFYVTVYGQAFRPNLSLSYRSGFDKGYNQRVYANEQTFDTSDLLTGYIMNKYKSIATEGYIMQVEYVKYLKIELTSKPYLISFNEAGIPKRVTNPELGSNAQVLGHVIIVNGEYIVINKDGIYELTDSETEITSFRFLENGETGAITYQAVLSQTQDVSKLPKSYSTVYKIGQCWGYFDVEDSVYRKIVNKYTQHYLKEANNIGQFEQVLQAITGLRIYAMPNTAFYLKEAQDSDLERHVIGETGLLEFYDDDTFIQGLYFVGPHLVEAEDSDNPKDDEFVETGITINSFSDILRPEKNRVYILSQPAAKAQQVKRANKLGVLNNDGTSQDYIESLDNSFGDSDAAVPLVYNTLGIQEDQFQALDRLAAAAVVSSDSNKLQIKQNVADLVESSELFRELNNQATGIITNDFYQLAVSNYINSSNRYIYYNGTWLPITSTNDVALNTIQAIVDYYCTLQQRRY